MGVTVAFNYQTWIARYPEFTATVKADLAQEFFNEATIYHRNDGGGPVSNAAIQSTLLNIATAHIAQLAVGTAKKPASDIVGRITTAGEGSVSVSTEMQVPPGTAQWWNQTKFGAAYWAATAQYRTMRYLRGPVRPINPFPFG